ncbi:linoleate 13S-lipoxygenase 2-1, chloroplastic [Sesbania bispinosa]|nr:linoleate 13S-lipoxygenase 2-1, chloroplastic [Sesbania bispinosa]
MALNNSHVHRSFSITCVSFPLHMHRKDTHSNCHKTLLLNPSNLSFPSNSQGQKKVHIGCASPCMKAVNARSSGNANTKSQRVIKAIVTVKQNGGGLLTNLVNCIVGIKHLALELVSDELHPNKTSTPNLMIPNQSCHS